MFLEASVKKMIVVYLQEIFHELKESISKKLCKRWDEKLQQKDYETDRWRSYAQMMIRWKHIELQNKKIAAYLIRNNSRNIAIYGCGDIGMLCCDELLRSQEIKIVEFIDRKITGAYKNIPIVAPDHISPEVDTVLITPVHCYLEIAAAICQHTKAKFISMEDVIAVVDESEYGVS